MKKSNLPTDPAEMIRVLLERRAKCIATAKAWQKKNPVIVNERMRNRRRKEKDEKEILEELILEKDEKEILGELVLET
jgi:hypothetical protein